MYVTDIKNTIFTLKEYNSLDFRQDDLTVEDLEQVFLEIEKCNLITIQSKFLRKLPASLSRIKGLKSIRLTGERLTEIPEGLLPDTLESCTIFQCPRLQLPSDLFDKPQLRNLSIRETSIRFPDKIHLPQLNFLYLQSDDLDNLPASICLDTLQGIQITSKALKRIPNELADCTHLKRLHIDAPLSKPLPNLEALSQLNILNISNIQFRRFLPDFMFPKTIQNLYIHALYPLENFPTISKLNSLNYLNLQNLTNWPKGLDKCINIESFYANRIDDKNIPDYGTCPQIRIFHLNHCGIDVFPDFIFKLKNVQHLSLSYCKLKALPESWENLPNLQSLSLDGNQIHIKNFDFLAALPKLKTLSIDGNKMDSPYILMTNKKLPLTTYSSHLSRIKYANMGRRNYGRHKEPGFLEFCSALGRAKLSFPDKKWFFDLVSNVAHVQELPELDLTQFLKGLNINFKPLRLKLEKKLIQKVLIQHLSTLDIFQNPLVFELPAKLKKGDCIYITGQTIMPKSEIKEQAEALDMEIAARLSPKVTHVVLGNNSEDWQVEDGHDFNIITERALRAYFSKVAPKYLEEAEQIGQQEMVKNVIQLLEHDDLQNIQIALEIMKGGGVPKLILEDLLVLAKTTDEDNIRQTAKDLLELHAPASWIELIKDRLEFHQSKLIQSPAHIRKKLDQLSETISSDLAAFFTFLLQKKWQGNIAVQMELDEALYEIAKKLPIEEKLLETGATVFVNGTTRLKKTEIKEKLEAININYAARYNDKVTHVLVGSNPKTWDIKAEKVKLLTENHLQTYLSQVAPQFLEQAAAEEGNQAVTDNLAQLLNSVDENNIAVALEMMDVGGVPSDLLPSVLVVAKAESNAKIRAKARKLLELYAPADWLPMIKNKLLFKGITANVKESGLTKKLDKLAKESSFDMAAILSIALFKKYERGLRFILKKSNRIEYQAAVSLLLEGTHLNFSRGLGYKNWRNTDPQSVILWSGYSTGVNFSAKLKNLGKIESIDFHNCKFNSMPKSLTTFTDLKELDLSHNFISKLPLGFHKLEKLEVLNLKMNMFNEFPLRIAKMKNLKKLDLSYNRSNTDFVKLEVPEGVRAALPNCEFVL